MGLFKKKSKGLSEEELFNITFDLRTNSRQLDKMAKKEFSKCEAEKKKVADAIRRGDRDVAQVYAQNVIRINKTGINYLNMSAKLDAVRSKIESANKTDILTKDLGKLNSVVSNALMSQNPEQIMKVMDKFDEQFGELDAKSALINEAMGGRTTATLPVNEVDDLISRIADEQALDASSVLSGTGMVTSNSIGQQNATKTSANKEAALE